MSFLSLLRKLMHLDRASKADDLLDQALLLAQGVRSLYELSWAEVDPARVAFDPRRAQQICREAIGDLLARHSDPGERRMLFQVSVSAALAQGCGAWAVGWAFAIGNGGVVRERPFLEDRSADGLADRATSGLVEWRAHLERLAGDFARVGPERDEAATAEAIGRVLTRVIDETGCEDAWHAYAEVTVAWLLESLGVQRERAQAVAHESVAGAFETWVAPTPDEAESAAGNAARLAVPLLRRPA